ncbi:hypothetical protein FRB94_002925 [Tulasnella sp. JGI-2019a]|nr:hypothetical protein FRB93_013944 [Tulasnella sp. JGI-2019a]KAG9013397.1 hypothetical protein FRB94_002925 [Tulasnella sp. JGI-2019a]KAG9033746.1 hypothetical protein FRB95_014433 [Tulasnella sp. JGI-2019a]
MMMHPKIWSPSPPSLPPSQNVVPKVYSSSGAICASFMPTIDSVGGQCLRMTNLREETKAFGACPAAKNTKLPLIGIHLFIVSSTNKIDPELWVFCATWRPDTSSRKQSQTSRFH